MNKQEIKDYNRLCAEILGFKRFPIKDKNDGFIIDWNNGFVPYKSCTAELKFHYDWNWIMQILKHIREIINVKLNIHDFECVKAMNLNLNPYDYDKEQVVEAIYQFLIWYNKNNKEHDNRNE